MSVTEQLTIVGNGNQQLIAKEMYKPDQFVLTLTVNETIREWESEANIALTASDVFELHKFLGRLLDVPSIHEAVMSDPNIGREVDS